MYILYTYTLYLHQYLNLYRYLYIVERWGYSLRPERYGGDDVREGHGDKDEEGDRDAKGKELRRVRGAQEGCLRGGRDEEADEGQRHEGDAQGGHGVDGEARAVNVAELEGGAQASARHRAEGPFGREGEPEHRSDEQQGRDRGEGPRAAVGAPRKEEHAQAQGRRRG
jgi:hypothetical protein